MRKQKRDLLKSVSKRKWDRQCFVDPTFMYSFIVHRTVRCHVYLCCFLFRMTASDRCQFATDIWSRCYWQVRLGVGSSVCFLTKKNDHTLSKLALLRWLYVLPVLIGKWLACQSMDNKVCVFDVLNRFKFMRKKTFKGHMVCNILLPSSLSCLVCLAVW